MRISGFLFPSDLYHMPGNKGEFALKEAFRKNQRLKFLQYVAENRLKYESVPCLCGNDEFQVLTTVDRYSIPVWHRQVGLTYEHLDCTMLQPI